MDRRKSAGSAVGSRARQVSGAPSSVSNPYDGASKSYAGSRFCLPPCISSCAETACCCSELNSCLNGPAGAIQQADDFAALYSIVARIWRGVSAKPPILIGPDTHSAAEYQDEGLKWFNTFVSRSAAHGDAVARFTFHMYARVHTPSQRRLVALTAVTSNSTISALLSVPDGPTCSGVCGLAMWQVFYGKWA